MSPLTVEVAIVGAGTAGCVLASLLDEANIDCVLIEKSRGLGGRCSRRLLSVGHSVDLGTQEFSIDGRQHAILKEIIENWLAKGYLSAWHRQESLFDEPDNLKSAETLCATTSINTWHKKMAGHLPQLTQRKVSLLQRQGQHWLLYDEDGQVLCNARQVIITSPPEQAYALLRNLEEFSYCERGALSSLPQYVCAIGFEKPTKLKAHVYYGQHPALKAAICENSKPGRTQHSRFNEIWILQSTYDWAQKRASIPDHIAAIELKNAFCGHFNIREEPLILTAHYWRLAKHQMDEQQPPFIWNAALNLGCCGGWLAEDTIQGAIDSAFHLFHRAFHDNMRSRL